MENFLIKATLEIVGSIDNFYINETEVKEYLNDNYVDINSDTMTLINNRKDELILEWKSLEYSRLREIEYAKLNQDEMRFDDLENGTDLWREAIRAIKTAIPKPS